MGDDDFDSRGLGNHAPQPVRQPGGMSVILDPIFQIARLADIKTVPFAVEHAVDAGLRRHRPQGFPDYGDTGARSLSLAFVPGRDFNPRRLRRFRCLR